MVELLLIDDDTLIVSQQVRDAFAGPEFRVTVAETGATGLASIGQRTPDVVLLDMRLPDATGTEIAAKIRAIDARIPIIFITTAKNAELAIEAMKLGAFDYLYKPLDLGQLRQVVGRAVQVAHLREPVTIDGGESSTGALIGSSQAMLDIFKMIGRVAAQDVTVLVTGESGTGKELIARAIWQHSGRAKEPFLALNCAAIPENLLESELFGYERGAFTGADRRRIGKFEQCNGGTILLDEIGDMPSALQAKILRVLQERTFERVGGSETIRTDVRVIAATHRDLRTSSTFRQDLYYRLGGFTIQLPPLRERGDDVPALVHHYIKQYNRELGREITQVDPRAMELLVHHTWPGNIRELQSAIRQALLHASGNVLLPAFLPPLGHTPIVVEAPVAAPAPVAASSNLFDLVGFIRERLVPGANDLADATHREVDRILITHALTFTQGNHRNAAALLGISRQTMRIRMRALGLHVASHVE
ncbi:MAG: sigma-54 dependent transcriptional regulator [Kofleriaceae bacterium]